MALVSLVTDERQFFKSCIGIPDLPERETPLSHSFCQYVVVDRAPLVVRDARRDDEDNQRGVAVLEDLPKEAEELINLGARLQ